MRGAAPEGRSGTRLRGLPAALCLVALPIFGQAPGPPAPRPGENLLIVERSDFSRYVNGSYVGHAYRESRAVLKQAPSGSAGTVYGGQAYLLEESLHDLVSQSRELDEALPLRLTVASDGSFAFAQDAGIPSLRGLTSLPADKRSPGSSWIVSGERMLDFGADGRLLRLPFLAECRFVGPRSYADRHALEFTARFATRFSATGAPGTAEGTSPVIQNAGGSHELDILVDMESGWPLFIRDRFDETFQLRGGGSERRSGFTLIFFEGSLPLDRTAAASAIVGGIASVEGQRSPPSAPGPAGGLGTAAPISSGTAAPSSSGTAAPGGPAGGPGTAAPSGSSLAAPGSESSAGPQSAGAGPLPAGSGLVAPGSESSAGPQPAGAGPLPAGAGPGPLVSGAQDRILEDAGVELAQSEAGIVLRVRDLHFIADSDQILPSDLWRLDAIAAALKALPGRNFLVEGYSASVGNPAGELGLSQKRAKRVADELAGRGIEAGRFLYKGWGSSRPLASNDTEAGRAENRRVEITVLD